MEKTLASMPDHVRMSALCNSQAWLARLLTWVHLKLYFAVGYLTLFSWWTVLYWTLFANLPILSVEKSIPAVRNFICWTFLATAVLVVAVHWLFLQTMVPRADKEYPLLGEPLAIYVLGRGFTENYLTGLAMPTAVFGVLIILFPHGQVSGTQLTQIWLGAGLCVLSVLCVYMDMKPPMFGWNVPNEADVRHASAMRQADHERQRLPRSNPGLESEPDNYAMPVNAVVAKLNFASIHGMQKVKDLLLDPARMIIVDRQPGQEDPANGILLHGAPGNGKTVFAEALAGELGIPFIQLTYGDVSSKWIGEMPKVLTNCFNYAKRHAPCIFFVDEIDSFIASRDSRSNNSEDLKITNTLLTQIVELRRHKVVLMGATNFLENLDVAAIREGRFDLKVEISAPDETARIGLLKAGVKKYAPELAVDEAAMRSISYRWAGFSVSRLIAVSKTLPVIAKDRGLTKIGYREWLSALRAVQGRSGRVPVDTKSLDKMVFLPQTREAIEMVRNRLMDTYRLESMGGTLPSGVLFSGPSGTGKTAAARALAKDAGWAFLAVAGPDLVADRSRLDKLYADAADIRPCIIFIDEADDVLRNRQYSSTPELCNKLLVLMDGTEAKVKDVVFVAATNHPDDIDPALCRAGRFTEKVQFTAPAQHELPRFIGNWLKVKKVALMPEVSVFDVAELLDGQTIADIEGVLQYAVNRAIAMHMQKGALTLGVDDLKAAARVVLASR